MKVFVNEPLISVEAKKNVKEALETGWLSSAGPFVKSFEEEFAKYTGVKHAVSVTSGTAALHLAVLSLGIGKGDEVIVPAFTMASPWFAVLYVGATPVFVDCELETYNIDPLKIEEKITPRTKAIMPVHIYGHMCDMDPIMKIAEGHNLFVIEDAAEAPGGEYNGKKSGSIGDAGCFSFYANKIITTGEGGMLTTNSDRVAQEARKYKTLYLGKGKRFVHAKIGYNYRMGNLQASVGLGELQNIEKYVKTKQWMADFYNKGLGDINGLKLPTTKGNVRNVYWMYGLVVDEKTLGISKEKIREKLDEKGVDTREFFYPPEDQPIFVDLLKGETFPNAKHLSQNGFYIPSGLAMTQEQIKYVIKSIREVIEV